MSIDIPWARAELASFLKLTELYSPPDPPGMTIFSARLANRGGGREFVASAQIVEQILDRVLPQWRTQVPGDRNETVNRWCQHREAAQRADAVLLRDAEVRERLGDDAPQLSAAAMHRWVWDGARSLWRSGHFREAVTAAARNPIRRPRATHGGDDRRAESGDLSDVVYAAVRRPAALTSPRSGSGC